MGQDARRPGREHVSESQDRDPTGRFTGRVDAYERFRPSYPNAVISFLNDEGLTPEHVIADVGSGTGLLSRLFLENGNRVYGVEPNLAMREAAEAALGSYGGFVSVDGRAEDTGLAAGSVDLVVAGQAFHWFDVGPTKEEFQRVLRPNGWIALIWNTRRTKSTPFLAAYEAFLRRWCPEYEDVSSHYADPDSLAMLWGPDNYRRAAFENSQELDLGGLEGRLQSSSYAPAPGHVLHEPMVAALRTLFAEHESGGRVRFEYDTEVYLGAVGG